MANYFASQSLFSDQVTELRTPSGDLIGLIEKIADDHFKAINYLKLASTSKDYDDAKRFILASFNGKPSCQTRIAKNQFQLF